MDALENHIERLAEDHENAAFLANALDTIDQLTVDYQPAQTNMVFVDLNAADAKRLRVYLQEQGIIIGQGPKLRLVLHLDVNRDALHKVAAAIRSFFS